VYTPLLLQVKLSYSGHNHKCCAAVLYCKHIKIWPLYNIVTSVNAKLYVLKLRPNYFSNYTRTTVV
jgi:hypothetical protein